MKNVLIVIDYQNDFVSGALANPAAAALEDGIAAAVERQLVAGGEVIFTRDTHDDDYLTTREGKFLPVSHCIKGTQGWSLYGKLAQYEQDTRSNVTFVDKPTFGSAALPAVVEAVCGRNPNRIDLCGVVSDICVVSNAIVLHTNFLDTKIRVHKNLCAAMTNEGHERAMALLAGMGYEIV